MMQPKQKLTFWGFLKGLFKVVIGLSLFLQSLLFLVLMLVVMGLVASVSQTISGDGGEGQTITVENGSALVLNPRGVLVEQAAQVDQFDAAIAEAYGGNVQNEIEVHELVRAIRAAKDDKRIKAMVLDLGGLYIPQSYASKAHYVADAIDDFKTSGKQVVAVGDGYGQETYMLAAHADTVMMHDYGSIFIYGQGRYRTYYSALLDKLKVTKHVFRVGTFKSALEPYFRDDMSEAAKEANRAYLDVLWSEFTKDIEEARGMAPGTMNSYANDLPELAKAQGGDLAKAALETGLVDKLASRAEQISYLKDLVGLDKKQESFKSVSYNAYLLSVKKPVDNDKNPNVAVVTAAGTIVDGEAPVGMAGGDTIAALLKEALEDKEVKAVVLRVDSPGGSAFASEVMRDQILALKEAGKPVVVSMGSLAASGGYWISANADEIWAAPTTITGSIGIFGFFMTYENTAAEAGVYTDGVGTTDLSGILGTGIGELPAEFGDVIQQSVENGYDRFLSVVGTGRDMSRDEVDAIAQGRVWIGSKAKDINLVDKLGTVDDAIKSAAALAGLTDEYDVVQMEETQTRLEKFMEALTGASIKMGLIKFDTPELFADTVAKDSKGLRKVIKKVEQEVEFFDSFNDPNSMYIRCLECENR